MTWLRWSHSTCRTQLALAKQTAARRQCAPRRTYTRPTFAPKPAYDIKHIRQNPGLYEENCIARNYAAQSRASWRILELHNEWLQLQKDARHLRSRAKQVRAGIAQSSNGEERDVMLHEAKALKTELAGMEEREDRIQDEIDSLASDLPNLSSTETPVGDEPQVIEYINKHPDPEPSHSNRVWRSHVDIGAELGILDFAGAAQTSGWGWYFLVDEAAMLEQALVQYALSVARKRGWKVVSPPSMVYSHIASACGFQPRDQSGEQQIYAIEQTKKDEAKPQLVLTGTAEIPLAGMKAGQTFAGSELPLKAVGVSRSYRAEAGARGADTRGLYRVHEFTKVEMFAWTLPDNNDEEYFTTLTSSSSESVFAEMMSMQKEIVQSLGLHCRVLEMPTTDLGASATRKRDIEAFFPSRRERDHGWGEVTSTSMCADYQSRRLLTRVRIDKSGGGVTKGSSEDKLDFPYTLNGTALAVPRVLAAILENGWNEDDRSVAIPEVLRPFMGGLEKIQRHKDGSAQTH